MQIAGDPGPLRFQRVLAFDSFPLLDFAPELVGALFHQPPQLRDPERCESQHHQQDSHDSQQARQRPQGGLRENSNVRGRIQQEVK